MDEKRVICQFLKDVKVSDSYASNIARCVNVEECKISGLKSHDSHVLFQRLLPFALHVYKGQGRNQRELMTHAY